MSKYQLTFLVLLLSSTYAKAESNWCAFVVNQDRATLFHDDVNIFAKCACNRPAEVVAKTGPDQERITETKGSDGKVNSVIFKHTLRQPRMIFFEHYYRGKDLCKEQIKPFLEKSKEVNKKEKEALDKYN